MGLSISNIRRYIYQLKEIGHDIITITGKKDSATWIQGGLKNDSTT